MLKLLKAGVVLMLVGTLFDLIYHAIHEPDEIFPIDMPWELADHLVIMAGIGLLILGGVLLTLKDDN